jgi:hypothetical protein
MIKNSRISSLGILMDSFVFAEATRDNLHRGSLPDVGGVHIAWAFVYIFFTNGIPFDSPNRSEPCTTF